MLLLKVLLCELVGLAAPLVTLVYRGGWFNTPDNPDSPHGMYEPKMRKIHERFGTWVADWWWLGVRNRAYGLRYALKPDYFKSLSTYEHVNAALTQRGRLRVIEVDGFKEWTWQLGRVHIIYGYRLRPIYDDQRNNLAGATIPFRAVNMDARPIISVRSGKDD